MNKLNDALNDPLDALLAAAGRQPDDGLRASVLAQTIGVVRRRRRLKRCALAAGLLACYLAGITTMGICRPTGKDQSPVAGEQLAAPEPQPENTRPSVLPRPTAPERGQLAVAKLTPFESWRRIGDHYLQHTGDISLAVAGYSQALDLASDEERAISPERDNWLLMALKDARAKEREHARSQHN